MMAETVIDVDIETDLKQRRKLPGLFVVVEAVTMTLILGAFFLLGLLTDKVYVMIALFVLMSGLGFIAVASVLWRNTTNTLALSQSTFGRELVLGDDELNVSVGLLAGPSLQKTRRAKTPYLTLPYHRLKSIAVGPVFESSKHTPYIVLETYDNTLVYINPRPLKRHNKDTEFLEALSAITQITVTKTT
jgi:hypothetical protein